MQIIKNIKHKLFGSKHKLTLDQQLRLIIVQTNFSQSEELFQKYFAPLSDKEKQVLMSIPFTWITKTTKEDQERDCQKLLRNLAFVLQETYQEPR